MKKNVALSIAEQLKRMGTDYFFLLTGGDQTLWIALQQVGIRMVLTRSEFSAVYMADGYARASGKPGITYGQAGPGAANVAAALADAFWARSPVVAITGATASSATYRGAYQDLNQMPMFMPVTRWSGTAISPAHVPGLVTLAVNQAMSGTRGPAHLNVPKDFFGREIGKESRGKPAHLAAASPIHPDPDTVREIIARLSASSKPAVLAGTGVLRSGAGAALQAFAEALNLHVATTIGGKTSLPADHPLNLGVVGRYSAKVANEVIKESDCLLVIGSRLGELATNGYTIPQHSATVLQIDIDSAAFDATYDSAIHLLADARLALESLLQQLDGDKAFPDDAEAWKASVHERMASWRGAMEDAMAPGSVKQGILSPVDVLAVLASHNRDITVVADTGSAAAWTGVLYPTVRPGSYFRAVGSLGWALPGSLGVQLARKEKVVCVTGDGGFGYHLSDVETAVRLKLPVIIVILNNQCLGFEYHLQKYRFDGQIVAEANDLSNADYAAAARALGAEGVHVTTREDLERAFKAALDHDGPTVLDVLVDREAVPPVSNYDGIIERRI